MKTFAKANDVFLFFPIAVSWLTETDTNILAAGAVLVPLLMEEIRNNRRLVTFQL